MQGYPAVAKRGSFWGVTASMVIPRFFISRIYLMK
jgi:hypothetical protein